MMMTIWHDDDNMTWWWPYDMMMTIWHDDDNMTWWWQYDMMMTIWHDDDNMTMMMTIWQWWWQYDMMMAIWHDDDNITWWWQYDNIVIYIQKFTQLFMHCSFNNFTNNRQNRNRPIIVQRGDITWFKYWHYPCPLPCTRYYSSNQRHINKCADAYLNLGFWWINVA